MVYNYIEAGEIMFEFLSALFSYIFIAIIYLFIFGIIRLIYMDIKLTSGQVSRPQLESADFPLLDGANEREDYGEYFGILRVIGARESVGNLSDEYILDQEIVTIGRESHSSNADIQIDDSFLSREHLRLEFDGEGWFAEDLNSRNGSFVNGESVDRCKLRNGDEISIGGVVFELEV